MDEARPGGSAPTPAPITDRRGSNTVPQPRGTPQFRAVLIWDHRVRTKSERRSERRTRRSHPFAAIPSKTPSPVADPRNGASTKREHPPSPVTVQYPVPSGFGAIATIGWFWCFPPMERSNPASPKLKAPPSEATSQYPFPFGWPRCRRSAGSGASRRSDRFALEHHEG